MLFKRQKVLYLYLCKYLSSELIETLFRQKVKVTVTT